MLRVLSGWVNSLGRRTLLVVFSFFSPQNKNQAQTICIAFSSSFIAAARSLVTTSQWSVLLVWEIFCSVRHELWRKKALGRGVMFLFSPMRLLQVILSVLRCCASGGGKRTKIRFCRSK